MFSSGHLVWIGISVALIAYTATGEFSPYLEMAHLPFELCSPMIVFIAIALVVKNEERRSRLLSSGLNKPEFLRHPAARIGMKEPPPEYCKTPFTVV